MLCCPQDLLRVLWEWSSAPAGEVEAHAPGEGLMAPIGVLALTRGHAGCIRPAAHAVPMEVPSPRLTHLIDGPCPGALCCVTPCRLVPPRPRLTHLTACPCPGLNAVGCALLQSVASTAAAEPQPEHVTRAQELSGATPSVVQLGAMAEGKLAHRARQEERWGG